MQTLLIIIHFVACLSLIGIVLLQTGRGAELGAAFGGASQTLFGSSGGSSFMGKLTTMAAIVFMLTCLGLTYFSGKPSTESIMENVEVPKGPAIPEAKPVQTPTMESRESQPSSQAPSTPAKEEAATVEGVPSQPAPNAEESTVDEVEKPAPTGEQQPAGSVSEPSPSAETPKPEESQQ